MVRRFCSPRGGVEEICPPSPHGATLPPSTTLRLPERREASRGLLPGVSTPSACGSLRWPEGYSGTVRWGVARQHPDSPIVPANSLVSFPHAAGGVHHMCYAHMMHASVVGDVRPDMELRGDPKCDHGACTRRTYPSCTFVSL